MVISESFVSLSLWWKIVQASYVPVCVLLDNHELVLEQYS